MNQVVPFKFESHNIQVIIDDDGEFHFIAKEVAEILGYSDASKMCERLDDDEKSNRQIRGLGSPTGGRGIIVINESGMYSAILGSNKPEAKPFKRWVTHDVIPTIRKTGSYSVKGDAVYTPPSLVQPAKEFRAMFGIARLIGCDKNAAAISANLAVGKLTGTNVLQLLGHTHLESARQDTQFFTPTELGKRIGTSARGVNLLLAEAGLQLKRGEAWEVTDAGREFARLYDTGKQHGSGVPITQTKWSPNVMPLLETAKEAA